MVAFPALSPKRNRRPEWRPDFCTAGRGSGSVGKCGPKRWADSPGGDYRDPVVHDRRRGISVGQCRPKSWANGACGYDWDMVADDRDGSVAESRRLTDAVAKRGVGGRWKWRHRYFIVLEDFIASVTATSVDGSSPFAKSVRVWPRGLGSWREGFPVLAVSAVGRVGAERMDVSSIGRCWT